MEDPVAQKYWFESRDEEIQALLGKRTFIKVNRTIAVRLPAEIVGITWVFDTKENQMGQSQN
jgi:hypothetical protein